MALTRKNSKIRPQTQKKQRPRPQKEAIGIKKESKAKIDLSTAFFMLGTAIALDIFRLFLIALLPVGFFINILFVLFATVGFGIWLGALGTDLSFRNIVILSLMAITGSLFIPGAMTLGISVLIGFVILDSGGFLARVLRAGLVVGRLATEAAVSATGVGTAIVGAERVVTTAKRGADVAKKVTRAAQRVNNIRKKVGNAGDVMRDVIPRDKKNSNTR